MMLTNEDYRIMYQAQEADLRTLRAALRAAEELVQISGQLIMEARRYLGERRLDNCVPQLMDCPKDSYREFGVELKQRDETITTLRTQNAELTAQVAELRGASQAVITRWDSPKWKDQEPTATVVNGLRHALAATPAQSLAAHDRAVREDFLRSICHLIDGREIETDVAEEHRKEWGATVRGVAIALAKHDRAVKADPLTDDRLLNAMAVGAEAIEILEYLQEQMVDTIYLDDGRVIDVRGGNLLDALRQEKASGK